MTLEASTVVVSRISRHNKNTRLLSTLFIPYLRDINHRLVLNSPDISHEPRGPNSNHQELRGSTSEFLTLVPKDTCQKSNRIKLVGSTYDRLIFVLNNIRHL